MAVNQMPSHSKYPSFFIVGAARSGTTSLWMFLKQHPDIFMPRVVKEPSYFCDIYGYKNFDKYLRLFTDANNEKAIGEASTPYLTSPESPTRIREFYPSAKIIVILRNPVDRAYSLYNWMIREGYEWETSFEKALAVEDYRLRDQNFKYNNPQYYYNYLYFYSGKYAAQIERYLDSFPRNNILFLLFDEFTKDPIPTTRKVYSFLGVDAKFVPEIEIYNPSQHIFSVSLQYYAKQKLPIYLKTISQDTVEKVQRTLFDMNMFLGRRKKMNQNTRHELVQRYHSDIQKTSVLIGHSLDHWLRCC